MCLRVSIVKQLLHFMNNKCLEIVNTICEAAEQKPKAFMVRVDDNGELNDNVRTKRLLYHTH